MTDRLAHRGPDDRGTWSDAEIGVQLGHRRLSIVDLSPLGHQPMISADGHWVIAYNGEIYNHQELRRQLDTQGLAPPDGWRGSSDTETLLQLIAVHGLEAAIHDSVGMFALALWDRSERTLYLARDRFGEKPLFYGWAGKDFLFASELKSIVEHPDFSREIARDAVETFAARTYIPAPLSIYRDAFRLPPASILKVAREAIATPRRDPPSFDVPDRGLTLTRYWDYAAVVDDGLANPIRRPAEALEAVDASLSDAIRGQSIADVPIGVFLSGGIDSATITALYQKYSSAPVRSFTLGFAEEGFDEAEHAREVAKHLGTEHHERYVSASDALDVVPALPSMFDEPFADSSQIPTFLVSRFAREKVTVALSGDGGDELFGGYSRYGDAERLWRGLKSVPFPLRQPLATALSAVPKGVWNGASTMLAVPRHKRLGSRIQKAIRVARNARSFDDVYASLLHQWPYETPPIGRAGGLSGRPFDFGQQWPDLVRAMYCDVMAYLPDDILCKVDRTSMAVSLETRAPFLDHRLAAVAARVPLDQKRAGGTGKLILRSLLAKSVPREMFERPKSGFALPVGEWLRGPLRDWAESLLSERALNEDGWFDAAAVRRRWDQHLRRERDSAEAIWSVLMFQSWLRDAEPASVTHDTPPLVHRA